ncbi:MAG: Glutamine amidotransferase subunit pdxT [Frankiales bacterium]|nr:Glutamine amidotransferase subunit pdxT [Frankiales bacterium]
MSRGGPGRGAAPRVGVLALQGDVREHDRALRAAGADPVPVRRVEDLAGLDGLVLPGGESTAISRLLTVFDLFEPLSQAVSSGLPVYGSCAGMILLAGEVLDGRPDQRSLGGLDVTVRRNAFGRQVDSFETDLAFEGVGSVHAVFIRAPWVERAGESVQVLARVPATDAGASPAAGRVVAVRQGPVLATSFHPELTGDGRVHALFVDMIQEARG